MTDSHSAPVLFPDRPGWEAQVRTDLTLDELEEVERIGTIRANGREFLQAMYDFIPPLVVSWTVFDRTGVALGPPSRDTLRKVPVSVAVALFAGIASSFQAATFSPNGPSAPSDTSGQKPVVTR